MCKLHILLTHTHKVARFLQKRCAFHITHVQDRDICSTLAQGRVRCFDVHVHLCVEQQCHKENVFLSPP